MPAPFRRLGAYLNSPLSLAPMQRSLLAQTLLQQSQNPAGIVSPAGTANKVLQGILARRQANADQQSQELMGARQQGLAGALSRASAPVDSGLEGDALRMAQAKQEAARRAATIIAGGLPNDPLANSILAQQAKNVMAPGADEDFTLGEGQGRYDRRGNLIAERTKPADGGKPIPDLVNEISDDLYKESQPFTIQLANIGNIRQSISDPSPAGDMGLVYGYMKMLDPTSAVREAEYATAENARGVPAGIRNVWNRLLNGHRLDEDQRRDFSQRAEKYFSQERANQSRRNDRFLARARDAGIPVSMFSQYLLPLDPSEAQAGGAQAAGPLPVPGQSGPVQRVIR